MTVAGLSESGVPVGVQPGGCPLGPSAAEGWTHTPDERIEGDSKTRGAIHRTRRVRRLSLGLRAFGLQLLASLFKTLPV